MKQIFTSVCAVMLLLVNVKAQIPTNGLVAYYPFSGNANDASGNGNNGTVNGATLTTDRFGKANSAYSFNGKNDYINIGSFSVSSYSLCSWVYNTAVNPLNLNAIISRLGGTIPYKGYELRVEPDSSIMLVCGTGSSWVQPKTSFKLQNNKWYFITATCGNGSVKIYINKQLIASYAISSFVDNSFNILLGTRNPTVSNGGFYTGMLDDIRIYNRALDSTEVKTLYNEGGYDTATNILPTNGLVAWYPFTSNAIDSSGNGNNGTVNGATLTTDRFGKVNSAYSFNGATSNIMIPNTLISNTPTSYSISLWFKIDTLANSYGNSPMLISDRSTGLSSYKYTIAMRVADSTIQTAIYDGSSPNSQGVANTKIKDKNWHQVIQVFNSSSKIVSQYIDGTFTGSFNNVSQWSTKSSPTFIGMWNGFVGYSGYFNGKIDDIRIYNRALDSTEINALYHEGGYDTATNILPTNGLVAWYPFTGNTLDSSGNNNHGANNGAILTTDRFGNANSAYQFSGKEWISIKDTSLFRLTSGSFAFWFKTPNKTLQLILNKSYYGTAQNENFAVQINPATNNIDFNLKYNSNCTTGKGWQTNSVANTYSDNAFHYFIGTFSNSVMKLYIDGQLKSQIITPSKFADTCAGSPIYIGRDWAPNQLYNYKGVLDDIRIYNRALDSTEVQALYHEGGFGINILPVNINSFSATKNDNNVIVNWSTATELNASHFNIQHSINGNFFTNIGTVKAIGTGANSYQFVDKNPVSGINYYRLENVDKDGSTTYSKVITVQYSANSKPLTIYPNPVTSLLTISGNHITKVRVIDNMGKTVAIKSFKDATNPQLSVNSLNAGFYHLRIESVDSGISNIGFIKQ